MIFYSLAYLLKAKRNVNLIAINWERASTTFNYYSATSHVKKIGVYVADFIDFLIENKILKIKDISLIGFSLGGTCILLD